MNIGPRTQEQMARLAQSWKQSQHLFVSAATGMGKTTLARPLVQIRLDAGGSVIILVQKIKTDRTLLREYSGFTRWTSFKRKPAQWEKRILLWPKLDGMPFSRALPIQREVFADAYDGLSEVGRWTVVTDDALYVSSNRFLRLSDALAGLQVMGRSSDLTSIVLAQRPSHIPLECYDSMHHAFIGPTRENNDLQRLANLGARYSSQEMKGILTKLPEFNFLWLPVREYREGELVNVRK